MMRIPAQKQENLSDSMLKLSFGDSINCILEIAPHEYLPRIHITSVGKKKVHVINFSNIEFDLLIRDLMRDLVKHMGSGLSFQVTNIRPKLSNNEDYLHEMDLVLSAEAKTLGLTDFKLNHVFANTVAGIVESTLNLKRTSEDEAIVVKWEFELHKLILLPGALEKVLSKLKDLRPEIMVIVEQEANHNNPDILDRVARSFPYYSSVFESIEKELIEFNFESKISWEIDFRRQITNVVAREDIENAERHETQAWWREQLHHLGFHPVRQWFNHTRGCLFRGMDQYIIEGENGCPVLHRYYVPLVFASAWKPELVHSDGGSDNKENAGNPESISSCLELNDLSRIQNECEEEGDPTIMREGNMWSPECPSINEIAASSEIFDILESVCHVYKLPLALTWISDGRETTKNSDGKNRLRVEETACYVNDLGAAEFVETCAGFDLEESQGVAGKALLSNIYFVPDVSDLYPADYPFVYEAWKFGLHGAVAIKIRTTYRSSVDYILEFFLPSKMREISEKQLLVNKILSTLLKNRRNSWIVCGIDLNVADAVSEVTAAEMSGITLMPNSGRDSSHLNASTGNKRRRTSEVWKHFEEVRENGELWAICKSCSTRYRGESTRGTTNLHKHLKSCAGRK
ncbi:DELLA PROTEIN RGA2-LIKE [Salix purpurea]|uniref:DELLA PROTEIN RGA2-LIKE n=1 Tax=Salix purpurea TaxID=77065 RepID=A0A9Q0V515_SALPP|nr:DELLA PROTEIN RGA2-LIKE [Salix purpurea]